jgi:hypothetical protein
MATVGDLEMPAKQWTRTQQLDSRTLSDRSTKQAFPCHFLCGFPGSGEPREKGAVTDELRGLNKVGQQFLAVAVVDGQPQEVAVLDEIRLGTIGADVDLVTNIVILTDEYWFRSLKGGGLGCAE